MQVIEIFEKNAEDYDSWYEKYPLVFKSEVEAIKEMLPSGNIRGIEVGLGTGRFCKAMGIKEGIEPSFSMRRIAYKRGIEVIDAVAEKLPYKDLQFDFVLMVNCISYFHQLQPAFKESHRVLKKGGFFIVSFIEKNSIIGKSYEARRQISTFYKQATFYTVEKVTQELKNAGFRAFEYNQTLFQNLDEIKIFEPAEKGFDKGSFITIKAIKATL